MTGSYGSTTKTGISRRVTSLMFYGTSLNNREGKMNKNTEKTNNGTTRQDRRANWEEQD
jgi:hypothetical protein